MMIRLIWISILTLSLISQITAQGIVTISESELLDKGLSSNIDLRRLEYHVKSAQGELKTTSTMSLPDIGISYTAMSTNQPLSAFGTKLNQSRIGAADFDPDFLNSPDHIEDFFGKLEIQHSFYNPDLKYYKKAAAAKVDIAGLQLDRKKDQVVLEIKKSYLDLQLAYKSLDVLNAALQFAKENVRMAKDNADQGYLQRSDLLAAELRQRTIENQIIMAESSIADISDYLSVLVNDDPQTVYQPGDSLAMPTDLFSDFDLNENRSDFKALEKVSEAYASQMEAYKKSSLPRIIGFANYELHDDTPFAANGNGYMLGVGVHWNFLGKKKQQGKISQSKAEYEKAQLQLEQYLLNNKLDLARMKRVLEDSRKNLELSELSVEQSEEVLRIRTNRFNEGLEKITDLLAAEADLAEKRMLYYKAIYQYNQARVYLEYLTKE
ncbi:MAG: TolC family protein [Saprospiraceae bacterium]|nr:TolC family protein [Saprospiraceae bacterium]